MGLIQVTELEQSISEKISSAVIHKLFIELERKAQVEQHDQEWFSSMLETFRFINGVEIGFNHARAYCLVLIKQVWEELPVELRRQYGFVFMNFARLVTGKEPSTINNDLNTAKIWFLDKTKPNYQIKIVERDINNKPLSTHQYKEFNAYEVPMSKLLLLNAKAVRNEITEEEWIMLVDPNFSCDDITQSLRKNVSHTEPESYWYCEADLLIYKHNTERTVIAQLNFEEYESDEKVKEGVDKLLSILNIKLDDEYIYREFKRGFIIDGHS